MNETQLTTGLSGALASQPAGKRDGKAGGGRGPTHPRAGVPELAGVCTYEEAGQLGFGVEENVALLKRYNWVERQLTELMLAHVTATPEWEVKGGFCLHLWLDAEHAKWLEERVAELRHPPHNFHLAPDPDLDACLQEALRSRNSVELLAAIYRVLKPALVEAYRRHMEKTHPLVDYPTRRFMRFMIQEEEEMIDWGEAALRALARTRELREQADEWEAHLRAYLEAAGGVGGYQGGGPGSVGQPVRVTDQSGVEPPHSRNYAAKKPPHSRDYAAKKSPHSKGEPTRSEDGPTHSRDYAAKKSPHSKAPAPRAVGAYEPDWFPRRDSRFESFNYHFPPHWVYIQTDRPASERMLALVCKRLLEMDVPEMMAAIIWRTGQEALAAGRPAAWAYTQEMCRQVWDEVRHSMMGEVWLANRGIDFTRVPLNIGFSLGLNQLATAREAHAALWWIEQGLMPKTTGKAYEWRTACEAGDPLATLFMDYDWADEVLHVHIGRRWLVKELGSREEAERLGEEAFARVMAIRRKRGLAGAQQTEQREWWPDFCEEVLGFRPEPLAPEVYETPDADAPWLRNA